MLNRIIPLLSKYVPTALAFKGIQKVSPKLKDFATSSIASGYTADQVIGYLRSRVSGERNEEFGQRPEEQASKAQVENSKQLPNALQTGAALGGAALGGLGGAAISGLSNLSGQENQSLQPDEIQQMPQQQRQLPYNQQKLIGETPRNPVPQQGEVIIPPITSMQQQQAKKQGALSKFQGHKKKQSMVDELYDQYQQGYGNKKKQEVDEAILESLAKILEM